MRRFRTEPVEVQVPRLPAVARPVVTKGPVEVVVAAAAEVEVEEEEGVVAEASTLKLEPTQSQPLLEVEAPE
jgi:hypothetical protein